MDLANMLNEIDIGWRETVKPSIEEGRYLAASNDMDNLNLALNVYLKQITDYHSGITFVSKARSLQTQLAKKIADQELMTEFETYLAQLKLSVQTGNTFRKQLI